MMMILLKYECFLMNEPGCGDEEKKDVVSILQRICSVIDSMQSETF